VTGIVVMALDYWSNMAGTATGTDSSARHVPVGGRAVGFGAGPNVASWALKAQATLGSKHGNHLKTIHEL